jgi:type I restriction enzyme R subunit
LENALRDPVSGEIGMPSFIAFSQNPRQLTQSSIEGRPMYPGRVSIRISGQVTPETPTLSSSPSISPLKTYCRLGKFLESYKTSKARVCVTVGKMTTAMIARIF